MVVVCTGDVLLGLLQNVLDVVGPLQENLGLLLDLLLLSGLGFVLLTIVVLFLVIVVVIKALFIVLFGGLVLGLLLAREGLLGLVLGQQLFGGLGLGLERVDLGYGLDSPRGAHGAHERQSVSQQQHDSPRARSHLEKREERERERQRGGGSQPCRSFSFCCFWARAALSSSIFCFFSSRTLLASAS